MNTHVKILTIAATLLPFASTVVAAHAFLDHAIPGVGSTTASPIELELSFTEGVVPALSHIKIAAAGGAAVAVGKPVADTANRNVLHVTLGRPLKAGSYIVTWHVVSVDSHPTSGTYKFTVTP